MVNGEVRGEASAFIWAICGRSSAFWLLGCQAPGLHPQINADGRRFLTPVTCYLLPDTCPLVRPYSGRPHGMEVINEVAGDATLQII